MAVVRSQRPLARALPVCRACRDADRSWRGSPSTRPSRAISSTAAAPSLFGMFTRDHRSSASATQPIERLLEAVQSHDLAAASKLYDAMLEHPATVGVTQEDMSRLMTRLSRLSHRRATALLWRLNADLGRWGVERTIEMDRAVLRGLCAERRVSEAMELALTMGNGAGRKEWRRVLGAAASARDSKITVAAFEQVGMLGHEAVDYALLLTDVRMRQGLSNRHVAAEISAIVSRFEAAQIPSDTALEVELLRAYLQIADHDRAAAIVDKWAEGEIHDSRAWDGVVKYLSALKVDNRTALQLVKRSAPPTGVPDRVLAHLIITCLRQKASHTPELKLRTIIACVDGIEGDLDAHMGDCGWSETIDAVISLGAKLDVVRELYSRARERGAAPDVVLAHALISASLSQKGLAQSKSFAFNVYADFIARADTHVDTMQCDSRRVQQMYAALLRACRAHTDASVAIGLLKDMRTYDVQFSTGVLRELMVALISTSPGHREAFEYYAHFHATSGSTLDEDAYNFILGAFLALSTDRSPFAPPSYVLEMMRDMRMAGHKASRQAITSLLASYARRAVLTRKTSSDPVYHRTKIDGLHKAIDDIHAQVKLGSIDADVPLLGALLKAYSHVGAYASAFQVWDQIVERRPREDPANVPRLYAPSVASIIDTCGRTEQYARGKRIMQWSKRHGITNQRVLEGWIECLCGLRMWDEAADTVCVQMRHLGDEEVREAVRVLLKFSWRDKRAYREMPVLVQHARPGLWESVKGIVETKTTREAGGEGKNEGEGEREREYEGEWDETRR